MFLVYNSDILTEEEFQLPVNDRAFQYGDGLFETIRYENDRIWFWPDHMDRLKAGMAALRFIPPTGFDDVSLQQTVRQVLSANELLHQSARIKMQVWRQPGGLYTPASHKINYLITARPGLSFQNTRQAKIGIYDGVRLSFSSISAFKTLNSLPYVLAGIYKQEHGLDDVILVSSEGHLAECIASNLFWFRAETLFTPSLQTGCINGIARRQLLRHIPDMQEGLFLPSILDDADVIFAANVMGIQVFRGDLAGARLGQVNRIFMTLSS